MFFFFPKQNKYTNHIRKESNSTKQLELLHLIWGLTQFTEMATDFRICFQLLPELFAKAVKSHKREKSTSEMNGSFYARRGQWETLEETSASAWDITW